MRYMKMSLIYVIRKCPGEGKKPGGAVEIDSSSFFASRCPPFAGFFTNLWVKFRVGGGNNRR